MTWDHMLMKHDKLTFERMYLKIPIAKCTKQIIQFSKDNTNIDQTVWDFKEASN